MQLRLVPAIAIYIGSYLPLSFILLGQDLDLAQARKGLCPLADWMGTGCTLPLYHAAPSLIAVAICTSCLLFTLFALRLLPTRQRITIKESKHIPADLVNYVIPYIVSFISLDYGDAARLIGFVIFLVWLFWITFQTGQISLNAVLSVLGWKLYEVKYSFLHSADILTGRVLAQTDIEPGKTYRQGNLQDIMIVKAGNGKNINGDVE